MFDNFYTDINTHLDKEIVLNTRYKCVIMGKSGVGKSSIMLRFTHDKYCDYLGSTVGAAFITKTMTTPTNRTITLDVWDTAGQERYAYMAPLYYRNSDAALVVYDITDRSSFEDAKKWVEELEDNTEALLFLVGNKCDMDKKRVISVSEGKRYSEYKGLIFAESSAKASVNIKNIFTMMADKLYVRGKMMHENQKLLEKQKNLVIDQDTNTGNKWCCR